VQSSRRTDTWIGWGTDADEEKGEKGFECPVCGMERYLEAETYAGVEIV